MNKSEKRGLVLGTTGATIGAISWLVILGIASKSVFLTALPITLGLVCVMTVIKLYNLQPKRVLAIAGLALLWLVFINLILGSSLYEQIPDIIWGTSTTKPELNLTQVDSTLIFLALGGFFLLITDILKNKGKSS